MTLLRSVQLLSGRCAGRSRASLRKRGIGVLSLDRDATFRVAVDQLVALVLDRINTPGSAHGGGLALQGFLPDVVAVELGGDGPRQRNGQSR